LGAYDRTGNSWYCQADLPGPFKVQFSIRPHFQSTGYNKTQYISLIEIKKVAFVRKRDAVAIMLGGRQRGLMDEAVLLAWE